MSPNGLGLRLNSRQKSLPYPAPAGLSNPLLLPFLPGASGLRLVGFETPDDCPVFSDMGVMPSSLTDPLLGSAGLRLLDLARDSSGSTHSPSSDMGSGDEIRALAADGKYPSLPPSLPLRSEGVGEGEMTLGVGGIGYWDADIVAQVFESIRSSVVGSAAGQRSGRAGKQARCKVVSGCRQIRYALLLAEARHCWTEVDGRVCAEEETRGSRKVSKLSCKRVFKGQSVVVRDRDRCVPNLNPGCEPATSD